MIHTNFLYNNMRFFHAFFTGSCNQLTTYKRREIFLIMQNCLSGEFNNQIKHLEQELSERSNCPIQIHPDAKSHM